jgi:hypothetical protein
MVGFFNRREPMVVLILATITPEGEMQSCIKYFHCPFGKAVYWFLKKIVLTIVNYIYLKDISLLCSGLHANTCFGMGYQRYEKNWLKL